jgi:hypothetical protein
MRIALVFTLILASGAAAQQSQEVAVIPLGPTSVAGGPGGISTGILSPDGKTVAYLNLSHLCVVNLETRKVKELKPDFDVFTSFYFSEDIAALYYPVAKTIYRLPLSGGPAAKIEHPASWNAAPFVRKGGEVLAHLNPDSTNAGQIRPWWEGSPDGTVVFAMNQGDDRHRIVSIDPKTGKSKQVASGKGRVESLLWCWGDGVYVIRVQPDDRRTSSGEIWFYPESGGEARQITRDSGGFYRIFGRTHEGVFVALRYRSSGSFWDGMMEAFGMALASKNTREKEAELVLIRPGK